MLYRVICIVEADRFIAEERPAHLGDAAIKSTQTDVVIVMEQRSEELLHNCLQ